MAPPPPQRTSLLREKKEEAPCLLFGVDKSFVNCESDQSALRGLVTPCLARGCRGRRCRLYRVEKWCTIYFCIPLCRIDRLVVVKCETCGKMFSKAAYLRAIQADRQHPVVAVVAASTNDTMERADATEDRPQENIPLVPVAAVVDEEEGDDIAGKGGSASPVMARARDVSDGVDHGEVAMVPLAERVTDETELGFQGSKPTSA